MWSQIDEILTGKTYLEQAKQAEELEKKEDKEK